MKEVNEIQKHLEADEAAYKTALQWLSKQGLVARRIARLCEGKTAVQGSKGVAMQLAHHCLENNVTLEELLASAAASSKSTGDATGKPVATKEATTGTEADKVPVLVEVSNFTAEEFSKLPEEVQEKEKQLKANHALRAFHRAKLDEGKGAEAENADHAKTIVETTDEILKLQTEIDYFKKNGLLPESSSDAPALTLAEAMTQRDNCASRISKLKAALKKNPKDEAKAAKLVEETARKQSLDLLVTQLQNGAPVSSKKEG